MNLHPLSYRKISVISADHKYSALFFILLTAITIIAYSEVTQHQLLNWDDLNYVIHNDQIKSITLENVVWMFTDYDLSNWHPVTWLSYALNHSLFGSSAASYKSINVAIHILNSFLIYFLSIYILNTIKSKFKDDTNSYLSVVSSTNIKLASAISSLLFAVHPLHVESVTWIAERKDVLSAMFYIATLLSYMKYMLEEKIIFWRNISLIFFTLSLMSKPMAVTLPAIMLIMNIYPLKMLTKTKSAAENIKILLKDNLSFIVIGVVVSIITLVTQRHGIQGVEYLSYEGRIINASMSIILYIYHFFVPLDLSPFYPYHPWSKEPVIYSLFPVSIIIFLSVFFIYLAKRQIYFPLTIFVIFVISLLPVIGIVKVGYQAAADRYTYIPMIGFFIASAGGIAIILQHSGKFITLKYIILAAAFLSIASLTTLTKQQNTYWENDEKLWSRAIELYPGLAGLAYSNMGTIRFRERNFSAALIDYNKSLSINNNDLTIMEKIGRTYEFMGKAGLALKQYQKIVDIFPDISYSYILLGDLQYRQKLIESAKSSYRKAFEVSPSKPATLQRAALADFLDNKLTDANKKLEYLFMISPDNVGAMQLAAKIHLAMGNHEQAKSFAMKILSLRKNDAFATEILAHINQSANGKSL